MRKAVVFAAALLVSLQVFAQNTLREGVDMIKRNYGVSFVYGSGIDLDRPYSGKPLGGRSLSKDLTRLFEGTDIEASAKGRQVVLKQRRRVRRADIPLSEVQILDSAVLTDWKKPILTHPGAGVLGADRATLDQVPVALGERDALKMLQLLPGVQAASEGFSGISVRGGYADENLILLDGIPVWQGEHAFGLFSAFPAEVVSDITLYKGNFPTRFGGRLSSVVDIRSAAGNSDSLRWGYTVGLLSDKIHADGPLGKRMSFAISGRAVHTVLAEPFLAFLDNKINYWFYDVNARLDWKAGSRDLLYLTLYNGTDWYRSKETEHSYEHTYDDNYAAYDIWKDNIDGESMSWGSGMAALHWAHAETGRTSLSWSMYEMSLANGYRQLINEYDTHHTVYDNSSETNGKNSEVLLKSDWKYRQFSFGGWAEVSGFRPGGSFESSYKTRDGETLYSWTRRYAAPESMTTAEAGLYAGADIPLGRGFTMSPGIRFSVYGLRDKVFLYPEPRIGLQWERPGWKLCGGYSRMTQGYHRMQSGFSVLPIDMWRPSSAEVPPMTGDHYTLGGSFSGVAGWEMSAELYYKKEHGITEYYGRYPSEGTDYYDWTELVASGEGTTRGAEFMLRKSSGPLTGWLSYTLSKSDRVIPEINGGRPFPASTDRRHRINLLASYKAGKRLDMTLAWTFATGAPVTVPERHVTTLVDVYHYVRPESVMFTPYKNNFRLPAVHRADFNINLHKDCRKGTRTWTLGLYNFYGANNPDIVSPETSSLNPEEHYHPELPKGTILMSSVTILTFIPTISFSREF